jgi:hypothetical protein
MADIYNNPEHLPNEYIEEEESQTFIDEPLQNDYQVNICEKIGTQIFFFIISIVCTPFVVYDIYNENRRNDDVEQIHWNW